jgi:NADPH:quinone reductase-like Zn-dependent oxidoreductase
VPPPWIPGWDAAGVVESIGPGVTELSVGDKVMAVVLPRRAEGGAQIELLVVPAASVVPIPEGATLEQASTLPMNGLTAFEGLRMLGVGEGDTLFVAGGAGHLASFVIPLAKRRGVRVIADAKPEDEELVRSRGADEVVPRGELPYGVDAVYDTALLNRAALPAIREGGGLAVVRGWDGEDVKQGVHVHAVWVGDVVERTDWLRELRELGLPMTVASTHPPEQAADAHRAMEAGVLRGRAVIVFD